MANNNKRPGFGGRGPLGGPGRKRMSVIYIIVALVCGAYLAWSLGIAWEGGQHVDTIATNEFITAVKEDRVSEANYKVSDGALSGTYWRNARDKGDNAKRTKYKSTYVGNDHLDTLMAEHPKISFKVDTSSGDFLHSFVVSWLPLLLLVAAMLFFMNQMRAQSGQITGFGKTKAKTTGESRPKTKFKDVAGIDEAVEELAEVRDFLADPQRFRQLGAKIPRGVLLVGPPGTGKTLLARAVAGEAGVPFFSISGSDFVEMYVGVGASRVRDLFKQAKATSPSIIFIDEIDAVGRQRGAGLGGGHDEREQTLNQLLVEMDGFADSETVILIAATNRPDILDPALLRPGRFDRRVTVDRPDVKGREQILRVHAADKPLAKNVEFSKLAKLTPGFTGADLMNLMNESAILAARHHKKVVGEAEIEEAMERVIAGPERKSRVMTDRERKTIAYHESGHALVGHMLKNSDPVHKISIVSRGQALGYVMQLPEEDRFLETKEGMLDQIAILLSGRTAEEIACEDVTTGASNDLERATKLARQMVTRFGMSDVLGVQVFGEAQHQVFLGRDYADKQDYSAETAKRIDDEVACIIRGAHARAQAVLVKRRAQLDLMAQVLLERETVEGEAVSALLNNEWDDYCARCDQQHDHDEQTPAQNGEDRTEAPAQQAERGDHTNQTPAIATGTFSVEHDALIQKKHDT